MTANQRPRPSVHPAADSRVDRARRGHAEGARGSLPQPDVLPHARRCCDADRGRRVDERPGTGVNPRLPTFRSLAATGDYLRVRVAGSSGRVTPEPAWRCGYCSLVTGGACPAPWGRIGAAVRGFRTASAADIMPTPASEWGDSYVASGEVARYCAGVANLLAKLLAVTGENERIAGCSGGRGIVDTSRSRERSHRHFRIMCTLLLRKTRLHAIAALRANQAGNVHSTCSMIVSFTSCWVHRGNADAHVLDYGVTLGIPATMTCAALTSAIGRPFAGLPVSIVSVDAGFLTSEVGRQCQVRQWWLPAVGRAGEGCALAKRIGPSRIAAIGKGDANAWWGGRTASGNVTYPRSPGRRSANCAPPKLSRPKAGGSVGSASRAGRITHGMPRRWRPAAGNRA